MQIKPYRLENKIQNYTWGMKNQDAFIPRLLNRNVESNLPYAELWMGDHPNGPSMILVDSTSVSMPDWIDSAPQQILGCDSKRTENALPFLFKVLSAGGPLSIQLHPDKVQAGQLHTQDPQHYPDGNHKPEIAIALDHLSALVGLRPPDSLQRMFAAYPEISIFMDSDNASVAQNIACLFEKSQTYPGKFANYTRQLKLRLQKESALTSWDRLFLKADELFPDGDIGLFLIYFMNFIRLNPGEALFIGPGVPHAYIQGNIIECMANSDNVIRAGLTPKFKDVKSLLKFMKMENRKPDIIIPDMTQPVFTYKTPVKEFEVIRCQTKSGQSVSLSTLDKPMILIVIEGDIDLDYLTGSECIKKGDSFFLPAALASFKISSNNQALSFIATVPAQMNG